MRSKQIAYGTYHTILIEIETEYGKHFHSHGQNGSLEKLQ